MTVDMSDWYQTKLRDQAYKVGQLSYLVKRYRAELVVRGDVDTVALIDKVLEQ